MRLSRVVIDVGISDLNEMLVEFMPDAKARVLDIQEQGIIGQVKLLLWNIDFVARPSSSKSDELAIEINASKLVPIPSAIVQRQLKEAIKEAPAGIDVIQQTLKVHLPSVLGPLGVNLAVRELSCHNGYVRLAVDGLSLPNPSVPKKDGLGTVGVGV